MSDQIRQFAIDIPIYSSGASRQVEVNAWFDASTQRSMLYFTGHSCEPNIEEIFTRVGHTRGFFVKTTRAVQTWDELTFDWGHLRMHRPCQDADFNCLCVRRALQQQQQEWQ